MTFFITVVLCDIMQIFPTDNNSPFHFGRNHNTVQNTTTYGYHASPRAFFIYVCSLNSLFWCLKTETYILIPTIILILCFFADKFGICENTRLFLESSFDLMYK